MKCPLGSPNKRFLLNTLGSAAVTDQSTNQRASERDEHRYKRACDKHRNTDCEKCNPKKDFSHRRYHSDSHSHTSKHRSSSRNHSPSRRRHSPHLSRKSKRTRSRSPVQDSSPDVKKYTDRGGKWCNTLCSTHLFWAHMRSLHVLWMPTTIWRHSTHFHLHYIAEENIKNRIFNN